MAHKRESSIFSVLFDIDGTLADTTYLHTLAWWRALGDAYQPVPLFAIQPLIGMGSSELLTRLLGADDRSVAKAHGRHFAALQELIRPLPGARQLIQGGGRKNPGRDGDLRQQGRPTWSARPPGLL